MQDPIPDFSEDQWGFLALMYTLSWSTPIDVLAALVPLEAGELFDLIDQTRECGWARGDPQTGLRLKEGLPAEIASRLRDYFTQERLEGFLQVLSDQGLTSRLEAPALARLLERAGRRFEAASLAYEQALASVARRDMGRARELLESAVACLPVGDLSPAEGSLYVAAVLIISRLSLLLGTNLDEPPRLLTKARMIAEDLGDRRSLALTLLMSGMFAYLADSLPAALDCLNSGIEIVESLGDEDIRQQTAEYRGIFYYIQGRYREAVDCFERAMQQAEGAQDKLFSLLFNFAVPIFLGHSAALLGQFHRAIGVLDASWRRALMNAEYTYATLYQASLGLVLLRMGKRREALAHLIKARDDAIEQNNNRALYITQRGVMLYHYLEGHVEKVAEIAHGFIPTTLGKRYTWPYGPQYTWPVFLEMVFRYDELGYTPAPEHIPQREMEKLIEGPNLNLRGALLRIRARQARRSGAHQREVESLLLSSEADLLQSGDPIELAKTRIEMARLKLVQKDEHAARELALKAWEGMSGFSGSGFPDDLKALVGIEFLMADSTRGETALGQFMDLLDEFVPSTDQDELLSRLIAGTCRFFGAERGGLFWYAEGRGKRSPVLRAGYNLSRAETQAEDFRFKRQLITRVLGSNQPLVYTSPEKKTPQAAVLCLPLELRGSVQGVLYHERSYTEKDFHRFDRALLLRIARHVSSYIERIEGYCRLIEAQTSLATEESASATERYSHAIVAESPPMRALLEQTDQVADSEAPVLILGETGVGKELLARRIHAMSPRAQGPFVAVEFSSIPENLIESELFGHEKGAFTGADRQKPGRLELANRGTLFIDEVGDIPLSVQVKLLRTLQEKSFVRVGGTRTLISDFRLVSATNRDLKQELAAGNFREDLFYRLNVVPLLIPPLRERCDDIVRLARHFLALYARRYNKHSLKLSEAEEARLMTYRWPGNVRELQNIMERSVILSKDGGFLLELPGNPEGHPYQVAQAEVLTLDEVQRRHIKAVLDTTGGRIDGRGGAAELLGMKRTTLYARMKKLGL